jgi:hypothetical protein
VIFIPLQREEHAAVMASSTGGYIAGRLRAKWVGVHTHDVYFRDTAHRLSCLGFCHGPRRGVLGSAASNIASGAAVVELTQAVGSGADQSSGPMTGFADALLRGEPAAGERILNFAIVRGELDRLFASNLKNRGDFDPQTWPIWRRSSPRAPADPGGC